MKKKYVEEINKNENPLTGEKLFIENIEKTPNNDIIQNFPEPKSEKEKDKKKNEKKSLEKRISECKKYEFKLGNLKSLNSDTIKSIDEKNVFTKCKIFLTYIPYFISFILVF